MRELPSVSRPLYVASLLVAALALVPGAGAAVPNTDPRWLPWIGCWAPSGASEDAAPAVSGVQRVCIAPVDGGEGVEVMTVANGVTVGRVRLDASGARQPVDREGCTGWESARWSADAERLYLRSELTCSGSIVRRSSGILAVVSPSDWVDVQVVNVGDQRSTRILRYRSAADSTALAREIAMAVRNRELARQTARLAAASTPTIADVVEASREVEPSVVEAWLLQRRPRFAIDGASLRRLGDARVPASTIDLVVALGAPERYPERLATRGYTFIRIDPPRATTVAAAPQPEAYVVEPQAGSVGVTIEGREFYGYNHRHHARCGHFDGLYIGALALAPYGFYGYGLSPYDYFRYGFYGYGRYDGYGYYPYDIYDPYRPAPSKPVTTRGPVRVFDLPDRRPTQPAPQPDPVTRPAGGRVVNGSGYTRPPDPETSRAATTSAPVPTRSAEPPRNVEPPVSAPPRTAVPRSAPPPEVSPSTGSRGQASAPPPKPAPTAKSGPETKPTEPAEARTAKRRPPTNR